MRESHKTELQAELLDYSFCSCTSCYLLTFVNIPRTSFVDVLAVGVWLELL